MGLNWDLIVMLILTTENSAHFLIKVFQKQVVILTRFFSTSMVPVEKNQHNHLENLIRLKCHNLHYNGAREGMNFLVL